MLQQSRNMIDISIIIVSYNTKKFLKECLDSLYSSGIQSSFEVLVVDNASIDGSTELVAEEYKDVLLIKNDKNLGFSKANNIGVKKSSGKYVLFLNSDTKVYNETVDTMIEFMNNNKDAGCATCKVTLTNGSIDDASHRGFPTPWNAFGYFTGLSHLFPKSKLFAGYTLGNLDISKIHVVDAVAGAFMIVRREAGEQIGWWDEDYFFYGEDLDFCFKLKKFGWNVYYVPTVSVLHYKGVSGGIKEISKDITPASDQTKKRVTTARFDAMRIFYDKHYKDKYSKIITGLVYAGIYLKKQFTQ